MKKIAVVLVLVALSFAAYTQAQPGRRGGGGGGSSLTIERDWALICFAVKVRGIICGPCNWPTKTPGISAVNL